MKRLTSEEEATLLFECLFCCQKENFVKQYWRLVFHTIMRGMNKYGGMDLSQHSEDIRNETFIRFFDKDCRRLWKYKLPCEGGKTSLAGWVILLTSQTLIDYFRRLKPQDKESPYEDVQNLDVSSDWLDKTKRLIRDNLEELSLKEQRLLKLRYFFGYTSKEIAQFSQENADPDIPNTPGAVDTALMRAKKKLKNAIQQDLGC